MNRSIKILRAFTLPIVIVVCFIETSCINFLVPISTYNDEEKKVAFDANHSSDRLNESADTGLHEEKKITKQVTIYNASASTVYIAANSNLPFYFYKNEEKLFPTITNRIPFFCVSCDKDSICQGRWNPAEVWIEIPPEKKAFFSWNGAMYKKDSCEPLGYNCNYDCLSHSQSSSTNVHLIAVSFSRSGTKIGGHTHIVLKGGAIMHYVAYGYAEGSDELKVRLPTSEWKEYQLIFK
ncbi:MAG: hypothetical protein EP343_19485 [Deltaproteobacteria bacterium]|nr:MAG: hypothetical protein EP343_19485 [Deltaproteobacteria bacterium]